jgi:hypothetical protein
MEIYDLPFKLHMRTAFPKSLLRNPTQGESGIYVPLQPIFLPSSDYKFTLMKITENVLSSTLLEAS